jgi:protoporphyrinogen/coproporphyrinogen III oxidase
VSGPTAVVVGGGAAGASAAHALVDLGWSVTLLERDHRLGGRIHSVPVAGTTVEGGAQVIGSFYSNTLDLMRRLGLADGLRRLDIDLAIVRDGVARRLRDPRVALGPSLLSPLAKLRLALEACRVLRNWRSLDLHELWQTDRLDQRSIAQALSGGPGGDLLEYLVQPVIDGLLYWRPDRTSAAMMALMLKAALRLPRLFALDRGLARLPEGAARCATVCLDHEAVSVADAGGRCTVVARAGGRARRLTAEGVVCAVPAPDVPGLVASLTPEQQAFFRSVRYSSTVVLTTVLCGDRSTASVLLCPARECGEVAAVTQMPRGGGSAPGVHAVQVYASGAVGPELCRAPDPTVRAALAGQAGAVTGVPAGTEAAVQRIFRWPRALPEFDAGHLQRVRRLVQGDLEPGNVVYAGDYVGGPYIEGAVTSGLRAAGRLHRRLRGR